MANLSTRGLIGLALMIVGTLGFLPVLLPNSGIPTLVLLVAAVVLTVGTYLIGTDVTGRAV
ncbi:MAG: hypothetical protein ACQETI_01025 [Halobacteriota archaeon]